MANKEDIVELYYDAERIMQLVKADAEGVICSVNDRDCVFNEAVFNNAGSIESPSEADVSIRIILLAQ